MVFKLCKYKNNSDLKMFTIGKCSNLKIVQNLKMFKSEKCSKFEKMVQSPKLFNMKNI
jgi:hypothetical protein